MDITWDNVGDIMAGGLIAYLVVYLIVSILLGKGAKRTDWREERLAESNCPASRQPCGTCVAYCVDYGRPGAQGLG